MKIYKISQAIHNGYDTYDCAIVCAEDEDAARKTHPSEFVTHYKNEKWYGTRSAAPFDEYETENNVYGSWVLFNQIDKVEVEYIGKADKNIKKGVICSSFNAG